MKRVLFIIALMLTASVSVLTSCDGGASTKKNGKATAKILSGPYELLLVAHKSWLTAGDGLEFRNIVERPILGIPQAEPNFRVTTLEPRDYKGKYIMYGNIFIANIDPACKKANMKVEYDVNAQPQVIVTVSGRSTDDIMIYLEDKKDSVLDIFVNHEIERERRLLVKNHSSQVLAAAKKQFKMSIFAPVDIETVTPGKDFFWSTSHKRDHALNVCLYTYPYTSALDFTLEPFIQKRDSIMKLYVQGDRSDQYMKSDEEHVFDRSITVNGKSIYVVRGLWYMEHDAMGGPFVSYAYLDKPNNRVVVAEGFIFAPEEKKRPLIRELEASLRTLTIDGE